MIPHVVGLLAANAVLLLAGAGFLMLIDAWRRLGRWSRFAVALLAGQALFLILAPPLLYVGLSVSPIVVLPLIAAVLVAGLLVTRWRRPWPTSPSAGDRSKSMTPIAAALVAAPLIALAAAAVVKPLYQIDTMLNWVMKAKVIWTGGLQMTGALDARLFARPDLHPQSHLEYPLGLSALFAWGFHWMGASDIRVMHLQLVLILAAAVGTAWVLLRPIVPDLPLAVGLAGLILMPAAVHHLLTAYADVPLALVWATGALALIRWAAEGDRYLLALATLLLAASVAVKQDGGFYDAAIYVGVAVPLLARRRPRRALELLGSAGVVALTAVPWQVYTATHDLESRAIRPGLGRMQAQTDRLLPTLEGMVNVVAHPRTTLIAVPLALALAIVCLSRRRRTDVVVPFLISIVVVLVSILFIYWNSAVTLEVVLIPALGRIMMGLIVLSWLLVPALAFAAVASPGEYGRTLTSMGDDRLRAAAHKPLRSSRRLHWTVIGQLSPHFMTFDSELAGDEHPGGLWAPRHS